MRAAVDGNDEHIFSHAVSPRRMNSASPSVVVVPAAPPVTCERIASYAWVMSVVAARSVLSGLSVAGALFFAAAPAPARCCAYEQ